jgi:microcystin degradation protein MlrC
MKLFMAGLITETNTFSPLPTGYANYAETALYHGNATAHPPRWASSALHRWRSQAQALDWQVTESLFAMAQPAGPTVGKVHEDFEAEILADLERAMPVDIVLLILHGAMVAEGCDDCEGRLLQKVRQRVGRDVPIGVELDLHCHITPQMLEHATAIVTYKEYPHTDTAERAAELFSIIRRTRFGEVRPVMSVRDCRMIDIWPTTREPMRSFVRRMQTLEFTDNVLSISLGHGFPWGDVEDLGAKLLVVTDDDPQLGESIAQELRAELWRSRERIRIPRVSLDEALERVSRSRDGPMLLADYADNPGGGAPGDSTFVLEEVLRRQLDGGALSSIWDPIAVQTCFDAGEGARLPLRIGGKLGPSSGMPLDVVAEVVRVQRTAKQTIGSVVVEMGDAVRIRCNDRIDVILNSVRTQTMAPDAFTGFGIDPTTRRFLIVKSMHHFHAGFAPVVRDILYVETPGALSLDFTSVNYRKLRRPLWPRVADPFAQGAS